MAGRPLRVIAGSAGGPAMATVNGCCAVTPVLSVASMVKEKLPGADGVPEMVPVVEESERPPGSDPADTDHVIAPVPPDDFTVWLYAVVIEPPGSEVVMIVSGCGLTASVSVAVAVAEVESMTWTMKV